MAVTKTEGGGAPTTTPKKSMGLLAKLEQIGTIELFFDDILVQKDRDGKKIAILHLQTPIPHVRGTQEMEYQGVTRAITARDVQEVKCHQEDMDVDGFEFDENGNSGRFKGDGLMLDVSQQGQVWMKKTPFSVSSRAFRTTARTTRLAKLFGEPTPTTTPADGGIKKLVETKE